MGFSLNRQIYNNLDIQCINCDTETGKFKGLNDSKTLKAFECSKCGSEWFITLTEADMMKVNAGLIK